MSIVVEKQVNAPPEKVFALMSDFPNGAKTVPAITRVEMLTSGPVGVGTKFKETRKMFGKEATETMEVTKFDPPRSFSLGAESCGQIYNSTISVMPDGAGSKLSLSFEAKPVSFVAKIIGPLMFVMFKGTMTKCFEGDLEAVKAKAEAG
jgi:carbon monoxide dehydrogenase subunit G